MEQALLEARKTAIATGKTTQIEADENAESLMKKIFRVGKKDLCKEGGLLHDQFEEMGTMSKNSLLLTFGGILSGMGVSAVSIPIIAVTVSVIVIHIGIKAFCEDCQ